jgi:hypothetical protein
MSFNSANCRGQLQTGLDTTNRTDVFNMPSWDIALCQLVNVDLYSSRRLSGQMALCPPAPCDKFRYQPHVHIVFHLARRLLLPLVPRRQQLHRQLHSANMHDWNVLFPSKPSGCLVYFCQERAHIDISRLL